MFSACSMVVIVLCKEHGGIFFVLSKLQETFRWSKEHV